MGEKLIVGPVNNGLKTTFTPFNIDNDAFPSLINAFQWRGRVKRKRGTRFLCRLTRYFDSSLTSYSSISTFNLSGGAGNLITGFSLQADSSIVPGSLTSLIVGANTYTDNSLGVLTGTPGGTGTINYSSGAITISGGGASAVTDVKFIYYPTLPVMGLEDVILPTSAYAGTLGFDTKYAYNILTTDPYKSYNVSFYKNPSTAAPFTTKNVITPTTWNGNDYQQFWTTNYQGALWATNGIPTPFVTTNIGMQYLRANQITSATQTGATTVDFVIPVGSNSSLVVGDFIFCNEFTGTSGPSLNWQTGYITAVVGTTYSAKFPNAVIGAAGLTPGIIQYLTNRQDTTLDCIRWYDGDPTNGSATAPLLNTTKGWVNFCPPISQAVFSVADLPAAQYYLVGAKMILQFKDRLLFFGPVVQTSTANSQVYLQDTVIYSQNGTPYYTASFDGSATSAVSLPTTVFSPILVPTNQTATPNAYFSDQTGFGGWVVAGLDQPINTVSINEDVLIIGFDKCQVRFVYTGDDILPFNFFIINSEYGSSSTFSAINTDNGVFSRGNRGYILTNQASSQRFDVPILDQVFEMKLSDNGAERFCAFRDFFSEWIYFTYPYVSFRTKFPSRTLMYNYRDNSWAIFNEHYTTYGSFRPRTGYTWATVGDTYPTWGEWNTPWNSGASQLLQDKVIAGNAQGFVMMRIDGTSEGDSLSIKSISGVIITSPNHCLNTDDYIMISGCLGATELNGNIYQITWLTADTFRLDPATTSSTYLGGGVIKRMYVPFIQSKQFPIAWAMGRKTRIGVQQHLLTTTSNSQVTLLIYLSQNASSAYNESNIVPSTGVINNGLIYSTILYTCPESSNLGLTPANTNLQMISNINAAGDNASSPQDQIWHRMNTSLIGDTVQFAITLNKEQMTEVDDNNIPISQFSEIEWHGCIIDVTPSQMLA